MGDNSSKVVSEELRASAAHLFVANLDEPVPSASDHHHLSRVLRLRPGEVVTVSDGQGGWRRCAWLGSSGVSALEPNGEVSQEEPPKPALTVGFALTKGQRGDWVVQKLTEAGVDRLVPVLAARSVVRWDQSTAGGHVERWRRLAREAAMQSRRVWLPEVEAVVPFGQAVSSLGGAASLAEPGGRTPSLSRPAILVGPEGGWSREEASCGIPPVSLGSTILRAETASVMAGLLLCALRARLVAEVV